MLKWVVLLSSCLHLISASFDYVYDEHLFMGEKSSFMEVLEIFNFKFENLKPLLTFEQTLKMCWVWAFPWRKNSAPYWDKQ